MPKPSAPHDDNPKQRKRSQQRQQQQQQQQGLQRTAHACCSAAVWRTAHPVVTSACSATAARTGSTARASRWRGRLSTAWRCTCVACVWANLRLWNSTPHAVPLCAHARHTHTPHASDTQQRTERQCGQWALHTALRLPLSPAPYAPAKTLLCAWISPTAAASRPKIIALRALPCTHWIHGVAARKAASSVFKRRVCLNFAGKTQGAETA